MDKALQAKGIANSQGRMGEQYADEDDGVGRQLQPAVQDILNEYRWGMVRGDERCARQARIFHIRLLSTRAYLNPHE